MPLDPGLLDGAGAEAAPLAAFCEPHDTRQYGASRGRTEPWYAPKRLASIFARDYLETHGIGAVVVATERAQRAATASAALEQLTAGAYAVYTVIDRTPIVTLGGASPDRIAIGNHTITAEGPHAGGPILVRRNWHPRWKAEVNGQSAAIEHRQDGYMQLQAPAGQVSLTLRYGFDRWDWVARIAAAAGLLLVAASLRLRPLSAVLRLRR